MGRSREVNLLRVLKVNNACMGLLHTVSNLSDRWSPGIPIQVSNTNMDCSAQPAAFCSLLHSHLDYIALRTT